MSTIFTLVRCQWTSYWRRLHQTGSVSAANQGILLLVLVLIVIKYFQLLYVAATNLTRGNARLLGSLLTGIFVALLFPLASGAYGGTSSRRLLHLPLSHQKLFIVRLLSLLIPPSSWLIVVASLAICYPIAYAPNPAAGIVAALLFMVMSWQIGVGAAHLLSISIWRKFLGSLIVIASLAVGVSFRNGISWGEFDVVTGLSPVALVVDAAVGKRIWVALGGLGLLAIVASSVAFMSFRQSLVTVNTRPRARRILGSFRLPGRLGGLIAKDLRYFRRLLDSYLGVLASVLGCFHLVAAEAPSADVARVLIVFIFFANSGLAFNLFGLDNRSGLDRYALLPLTGRETLLSKNLAFALLVGAQLAPILMLVALRLGFAEAMGEILEALAVCAAYLAWGNWMSVSHPLKLQFFRLSSSGSALADNIGGLIFGSAPGVVAIYALRNAGVPWLVLVVTLFSLSIYVWSVVLFGRRFEQRREQIAAALA